MVKIGNFGPVSAQDDAMTIKFPELEAEGYWNKDGYCHIYLRKDKPCITVAGNITETSTWKEWKKYFIDNNISEHTDVYRLIKAIFDGHVKLNYNEKYIGYVPGYSI